ncbi:RNA polymerase sigma factor SigJ [Longispora sp. NPDC051575]|uniref:RNA polymerase sigma factor SigJ n=1 Tax=Longispora sp. NPDC051575 TaxID=3154943 RepID=UPI003415D9FC
MEFEEHRAALTSLAYRVLGSRHDAEDIVQEAWLRWRDATDVRNPRGFLFTVVTRLAIDRLRSRAREPYVGPWLPEPVPTPADVVDRRAEVSLAALRLMERLTPPQRAVYVLREAFDLPYAEIAAVLEVTEPGARQLHRRAAEQLADGRARFEPDKTAHRALVDRFLAAASTGDSAGLHRLLAEDVVLWSDGGGRVRAALQPIYGADRVARFLLGVIAKFPSRWERAEANGGPVLFWYGGTAHLWSFEVTDGRIVGVQSVSNPDKLVSWVTS